MPKLSIITATFNRAHLLGRLYNSLKNQSDLSFEWIIVDDGSTDDTHDLVAGWLTEAPFKITYSFQKNSGKASAYNRSVRLASGKYTTCVDSDDWLPSQSVRDQISTIENYSDNPVVCGVTGVSVLSDGSIIGEAFPAEGIVDSKQRLNAIAPGDKINVFRTEILKNYTFPSFPNEKFLPESVIYNRMFQDGYRFASTNKVLQICDYQIGGLSDNALTLRLQNLNGTLLYYHEAGLMDFSSSFLLRASSNHTRYALHKLGVWEFLRRFTISLPATLVGFYFYLRDRVSLRS